MDETTVSRETGRAHWREKTHVPVRQLVLVVDRDAPDPLRPRRQSVRRNILAPRATSA